MFFILTGPDNYRREESAKMIIRAYTEKHGAGALQAFDMSVEGTAGVLIEFCRTPGLFDPFRFAILKNLSEIENGSELKELKKHLKSIVETKNVLALISEPALSKDFAFLKQKPNTVQTFELLPRGEFVEFLKQEAAKRKMKINAEALTFLAEVCRGDSVRAVNELQKLSFLKNREISVDFLKTEEGLKQPHEFFNMLRGFVGTSVPQKLKTLESLLALREDPAKIFNVLAYLDLRNIGKFADYDVLIKSGKLDYEEALLELALSN